MARFPAFCFRTRAAYQDDEITGGMVWHPQGLTFRLAMGSASGLDDNLSVSNPVVGQLLISELATTNADGTQAVLVNNSSSVPTGVGLAGDHFSARDDRHYRRRLSV